MKSNFEFTTHLQYEVKRLSAQVAEFRSGEKYIRMNERIRLITEEKNADIKKLKQKLSSANTALVTMRRNWNQVADDMEKEHEKELAGKDAVIETLKKKLLKTERKLDETKDTVLEKTKELYGVRAELEDVKERNQKLRAQLKRNHENSSIPSSMKPNRKKIANSREKTGRKPGGQPGHKGNGRKKHIPTRRTEIPVPEEFKDASKYRPTGKTIAKQVVNLTVGVDVTEYSTPEYRNTLTGSRVHAPFPGGVVNEVHYDGTVRAFAYLLNNHCCVSIDKVRGFISEITGGELEISKGMINNLVKEFACRAESERKSVFSQLLRGPVMNMDFSVVRLNGKSVPVLVCANPENVMYFAKEHKGHEGVKGTPVEDYQGISVHDHDKTFYSYGTEHQECMAHVLRYLKDSTENEPGLTWNVSMRELIREMIHCMNGLPPGIPPDPEETGRLAARYAEILETARREYEYEPPGKYYRDGYNLYRRLDAYKDSHLLFLHDTNVPATNNLAERLLRVLKRKSKQVMAFRSFDNLEYRCSGMSVIESLRSRKKNLYAGVASIFAQNSTPVI